METDAEEDAGTDADDGWMETEIGFSHIMERFLEKQDGFRKNDVKLRKMTGV